MMKKATNPFATKLAHLTQTFGGCSSKEAVYQKIIEFGKELPPFEKQWQIETNLVRGCQSTMYLQSAFKEGKLHFAVYSDALISAGLAALLLTLYNGETPEVVIQQAPTFLQECGITEGLTPGRANGLASLYLRMKQEALNYLVSASS